MMSSRLLHHTSTQSFRDILHEGTARFLHHSTARAFREWVESSSNGKRLKRIALRTTRRLCHRTTVQAWGMWAEELVKSQRKRHLVAKAVRRWVGRWTNAAVSNAFQMWADALERKRVEQKTRRAEKLENDNSGMASKLHEVREENKALLLRSQHMTERGEAHRQRLLLRLSSRLLHRSTGRALLAWARNARDEREWRSKVGLASRRWRQRDVASAYQTWHEHVVNMKMRVMLNKAVPRWRLLGLLVPFRRWSSRVGLHTWLLSTSGKVASRRQKLETSVVFCRWMEAVAKQNLLRTTGRRIICRLLYHSKARAFRDWVESLNGKRIKRVEWRIARTLCHRMIASRLCHRRTAQAWDRWADEVVKAQRKSWKRYLVAKAVGRRMNAAVSIFFQMWADALERKCHRRQINGYFFHLRLNKAVQRWRLCGLLVPFRRWRSRAVLHKWLLSTFGKVASRRQKLETSVVFGRWIEAVAKQNLLRTTGRRIICRLLYHSKARAFRAWVESLNGKRITRVEWRIARTLCHRMIASRLCHRRTAQAWDRWADEVVKAQRKRYLVEKAVGRWANAAVSIFFQMWANALERKCHRRQINGSFAPVRVPTGGPTPTTQFSCRRGRQIPVHEIFFSQTHTKAKS
jgi:hypothetical protein